MSETSPGEQPEKQDKPDSTDWYEKEDEIFKNLEEKILILENFQKEVESCNLEDEEGVTESKLRNFLSGVESGFPQEVLNLLSEYRNIKNALDKNDEAFMNGKSSDKNYEEAMDLFSKRDKLLENKDVIFLASLDNITEDLVKKNKLVKGFKRSRKELIHSFSEELFILGEEKVDESKIKDIFFDAFGVSVVVEPDYFVESVEEDLHGKKLIDGPFSIINSGDASEIERTIEHERMHNILEGEFISPSFNVSMIEHVYEKYKKLSGEKNSDPKKLEKQREKVMEDPTDYFIESLHEEILAVIDVLEQSVPRPEITKQKLFIMQHLFGKKKKQSKLRETKEFTEFFGKSESVKSRVIDTIEIFEQYSREIKDEQVSRHLKDLRKRFGEKVVIIMNGIRDSIAKAKVLGPEAERDVHYLFFLLKPTQYRHIEKFIESKYF